MTQKMLTLPRTCKIPPTRSRSRTYQIPCPSVHPICAHSGVKPHVPDPMRVPVVAQGARPQVPYTQRFWICSSTLHFDLSTNPLPLYSTLHALSYPRVSYQSG